MSVVWGALDIVRVCVLLLATPFFGYIFYKFRQQNEYGYLKQVMFLWYTLVPAVTIAQIVLTLYFPSFHPYATCIYNLAGQLIISTGVADSLQLMYILKALTNLKTTNKKALLGMVAMYLVSVVVFLIAVLVPSLTLARVVTITFLVVEVGLNVLLIKRLPKKAASVVMQYYLCNFGNRTLVLLGILLAIAGSTKLVVSIVHFVAVFFIFLAMFRIRNNLKIKAIKEARASAMSTRPGSVSESKYPKYSSRVSAASSSQSALLMQPSAAGSTVPPTVPEDA